METNEKVYMRRLARRSMEELVGLREFVSSRKGEMRFASMMLRCITAAILVKAGLEPA